MIQLEKPNGADEKKYLFNHSGREGSYTLHRDPGGPAGTPRDLCLTGLDDVEELLLRRVTYPMVYF